MPFYLVTPAFVFAWLGTQTILQVGGNSTIFEYIRIRISGIELRRHFYFHTEEISDRGKSLTGILKHVFAVNNHDIFSIKLLEPGD